MNMGECQVGEARPWSQCLLWFLIPGSLLDQIYSLGNDASDVLCLLMNAGIWSAVIFTSLALCDKSKRLRIQIKVADRHIFISGYICRCIHRYHAFQQNKCFAP